MGTGGGKLLARADLATLAGHGGHGQDVGPESDLEGPVRLIRGGVGERKVVEERLKHRGYSRARTTGAAALEHACDSCGRAVSRRLMGLYQGR